MDRLAQLWRHRRDPELLITIATLMVMLVSGLSGRSWQVMTGWAVVIVVASWLPLIGRTVWPLPVLAIAAAIDTVHIGLAGHAHQPTPVVPAATMLALYTVGSRYSARVAWLCAAVVALVQVTVGFASYRHHVGQDLLYLNWAIVTTAVGRLIQERRYRITAAEERAEAAERSRQAEADRQVTAERIRIAHELHDVLAHHIAVVNAQAGVAQYLLRTDPDTAAAALAGIVTNSAAALDELRATLGLLRAEGDVLPDDRRAPVPTVAELDRLLGGFTEAGLRLAVTERGERARLSGRADLAFYRIVQEALTNATKHAPGSEVALDIDWSPQSVELTVTNSAPPDPAVGRINAAISQGTGHGLIGMRERAAAADGSARSGATADGGYQVAVRLPVGREPGAPTSVGAASEGVTS
jgi:signal transduction histidine kinase